MARHLRFRAVFGITTLAGLCLQPSLSAPILPSLKARAPEAESQPLIAVPADPQLQALGARIGEIRFNKRDLFDRSAADEDTLIARLANRLHTATLHSTIANQLLFHSGDSYVPGKLAESARLLRDTRYLRDASIRPVAFHDGVVDVEVVTQDVWALTPSVSFGRRGGVNTSGFEIEDLNFLGKGVLVGLGMKSSPDRDSKYIRFHDRQLGASWWDLSAGSSDNSDGRSAALTLDHPFYALDSRWAAGVSLLAENRIDSRYDLGEIADQFVVTEHRGTIYIGRSSGLERGWARRFTAGLTFDDRAFGSLDGDAPTRLLPTDRRLVYPWIGAEWMQDAFRTDRNRDQIEKTEDYSLGWRARLQLGLASPKFGADRAATLFSGSVTKGLDLSPRQALSFSIDGSGRIEAGGLRAGLIEADARYYFRQSPRRVFFMNLSATAGSRPDADQQLLLGGDNGLRGYPLRYQSGTGRWLFTAEQRLFTNWYPLQLFNVGAAVFYDMGATWGRDPLGSAPQGLLRDIGVGLRLGSARSARGNVLHIDLAAPLDGDSSLRSLQFLVATRKSF